MTKDFWEHHWQIWSTIWTGVAAGAFAYTVLPQEPAALLLWLLRGLLIFLLIGGASFLIVRFWRAIDGTPIELSLMRWHPGYALA